MSRWGQKSMTGPPSAPPRPSTLSTPHNTQSGKKATYQRSCWDSNPSCRNRVPFAVEHASKSGVITTTLHNLMMGGCWMTFVSNLANRAWRREYILKMPSPSFTRVEYGGGWGNVYKLRRGDGVCLDCRVRERLTVGCWLSTCIEY